MILTGLARVDSGGGWALLGRERKAQLVDVDGGGKLGLETVRLAGPWLDVKRLTSISAKALMEASTLVLIVMVGPS